MYFILKVEDDYKHDRSKEVKENSCRWVHTKRESSKSMVQSNLTLFYIIIVHSQSYPKKTQKAPYMNNESLHLPYSA